MFTKREFEVFGQLKKGLPAKTIAYNLSITVSTIKKHTEHIYKKLGIINRSQLYTEVNIPNTFQGKRQVIFQRIIEGYDYKTIAHELNLSKRGVAHHTQQIFKAYGVTNRYELSANVIRYK